MRSRPPRMGVQIVLARGQKHIAGAHRVAFPYARRPQVAPTLQAAYVGAAPNLHTGGNRHPQQVLVQAKAGE